MTWLRTLITIFILIFSTLSMAHHTTKTNKAKQSYVIATLDEPPFSYLDQGQTKGMLIDLIEEIFARMKKKVTIKIVPWKKALALAKAGKVDGIFPAAKTEEREQYLNYTIEPLYIESYDFFTLKKGGATYKGQGVEELRKYRVGVIDGYVYGGEFQTMLNQKHFKKIVVDEHIKDTFKKLEKKQIDFFVSPIISLAYALQKDKHAHQYIAAMYPDKLGTNFINFNTPTYLAFSKKTTSRQDVEDYNNALESVIADKTYYHILNPYYEQYLFYLK